MASFPPPFVTVSLNPSDTPKDIMTVNGFQLVATVSINTVLIRIRPYSSTAMTDLTIISSRVEKHHIGGTSQANTWDGVETDSNKTASYSNPYTIFNFTQYVLDNNVTCSVDIFMNISVGNSRSYIRIWMTKQDACTLKINMSTARHI